MTPTPLARIREAVIAGAFAGVGAGLVFVGAIEGWAYAEPHPVETHFTASVTAGAKYGAWLWLAVNPVSFVDAALRAGALR